jgi:prophage tail gpP-like protein
MVNPTQIATVIANNQKFTNWLTVEVRRSYDEIVAHATLVAVEGPIKSGTMGPINPAFQLNVGQSVTVLLAGQLAISGYITIRQPSYTADMHGVQIVCSSLVQNTTISTVDAAPGQYLNMTLAQIAAAVFGKVNVGFSIVGSPPGANKIFDRISEMIGETRFQFIERLCRMRNVHMVDDGHGNVLATRGPGGTAATLVEGQNILKARAVMSINDSAESLTAVGQAPPTPLGGMGDMSSTATTGVPNVKLTRPVKFACEINADNQDCAMRVGQERDQTLFDQLEADITVKDWLMADGDLWINHVNDTVTVYSPMLFPQGTATLYIRGVVHRQSSEEGTTTDLILSQFPGGESLIGTDAAVPPAVDIHPGL